MFKKSPWAAIPLLMSASCFSPFALADSKSMSAVPSSPFYLSEAKQGWYYDTYIGLGTEPTYAGSDDTESEVEANARATFVTENGSRYYISLGEVGGYWSLGKDTQLVAFFEYEEGRETDDDPIFEGFENIDSTLEGQLFLVHRWGNVYLSAALQPDLLGRGKGLVWFLAAGYDWFPNDSFRTSISVDISGANKTYMETEFGITESASLISGLDEYSASAGLKSFSTIVEAEYQFSKSWSIISNVEWELYLDAAEDSPLIKDNGNKNNYSANVLLRYRF